MNIMRKLFLVMITVLFGLISQVQAMEFDDLGGIEVHGFISQGYLQSDENNFFADTESGTTQFNEMGINFSADVTEKLRLGVQFFARDMGDLGNNDVVLDWAIADYRWRDWLGLRAGNMKWVNGLYNESRDVDMLRTPIFLPQGVYNEAWREASSNLQGAGIYGDISMNAAGGLAYDAQYGSLKMEPDGGASKLLKDQLPETYGLEVEIKEVDADYTYTGALKWSTPLEGLILGGNTWGYKFEAEATSYIGSEQLDLLAAAAAGQGQAQAAGIITAMASSFKTLGVDFQTYPTTFKVKTETLTGSMEYTWRNLVLAAEYMQTTYNITISNDLLLFSPLRTAAYDIPEFDAIGYYGSLSYRFTYWFELGFYYSEYYRNSDDKDGEDRFVKYGSDPINEPKHRAWLKDACLTTRFDINENWVLKLEGHVMNGTAVIFGADNPPNPTEPRYEEDWFLGAAKVTYSF